jgi:cobalt-zinc-cadmium efflux system protein
MSQNEKILSWHLLEDIMGWIFLLIGAIIIRFWNEPVIDPITTIGFTIFVLWGVSRNAKETLNLLYRVFLRTSILTGLRNLSYRLKE